MRVDAVQRQVDGVPEGRVAGERDVGIGPEETDRVASRRARAHRQKDADVLDSILRRDGREGGH